MELPHLTLYLRRMAAPLPRGAGVRALLASPGLRLWLILAGWLVVGTALVVGRHWLDAQFDGALEGVVSFALVWGINLALYFPLTAAMSSLVGEPGPAHGKWLRELNPPLWYASLTPSWQAVLGTLCVALLTVAPTAIGATLVLAVREYFTYHDLATLQQTTYQSSRLLLFQSTQFWWDWAAFLWNNLGALLRMPQLALATAALCLALRRTTFASILPLAVTVTACLGASAGQTWGGGELWGAGHHYSLAIDLAGATLLLLGANRLLRRLAAAEQVATGMLGALFGLCILPCVLSGAGLATGEMPGAGSYGSEVTLTAFHTFCSSYLPDLQPLTLESSTSFAEPPTEMTPAEAGQSQPDPVFTHRYLLSFYGRQLTPGQVWLAVPWPDLLCLAFWFFTAVQCLDAARGRGRRAKSANADSSQE